MEKLTLRQMQFIAHSLGIRLAESVLSHRKKDKTLPKIYYRNYFNTGRNTYDYPRIKELVDLGLMEEFRSDYYAVTEFGKEMFAKQFDEITNYQPIDKRDLEYLRHRINFYCDHANYRFCDNNADHIFSSYQHYTLKGLYTSHTTTIVIQRFKPELKRFFKKEVQNG